MDRSKPEGAPDGGADPQAELDRLAEDWITLWQSEIAAMAADREAAEGWAAATQAWAAMGAAWLRAASAPGFRPGWTFDGGAAAQPPPWPTPAGPAPDAGRQPRDGGAGDAAGPDDPLRAQLAELERRLAAVEGRAGGKPADRRGTRRRKPQA